MDYAILKTGSKQYRVKPGDVIDVEKLPVEEGSSVELTDVLAVSRNDEVVLGNPLVPNASILAQVRAQDKDKKVIVFKYKRKTRYRRKKGHRQPFTRLAITAILLGGEEIGVVETPVLPQEKEEGGGDAAEPGLAAESLDESRDAPIDKPEDEKTDSPREEAVSVSRPEIETPQDPTSGGGER